MSLNTKLVDGDDDAVIIAPGNRLASIMVTMRRQDSPVLVSLYQLLLLVLLPVLQLVVPPQQLE